VIPLEVWDLEIGGATLFDARGEPDFAARLVEAARRLRAGEARRRAGAPLDARCSRIGALVIGGGGAAQPDLARALARELARAQLPSRIDPAGAFCGEAGGFALLCGAGGLVIDAGQFALKLSWQGGRVGGGGEAAARGRLRIERDFSSLPANVAPRDEHRERLREFLGGAIARAVDAAGFAPARVVLALPSELDDALQPGACSYPSMEGDRALVGDVLARAGLAHAPADVLNDAELAALSARAAGLAPADAVTLVLTIGWGVGGALVVPGA